jgi:hypothetical protein
VEDDHEPFLQVGIPAVDLISLDYGPFNIYWHTSLDTGGKCSAASFGIVGRVLLSVLSEIETGRIPKTTVASLETDAAAVMPHKTER